jgi:hypothetical protein
VSRAEEQECFLCVSDCSEKNDADRDDREPGLARRDPARHLGLVCLDLLDRQDTAILEAAATIVLHPSRAVAADDAQKCTEEQDASGALPAQGGAGLITVQRPETETQPRFEEPMNDWIRAALKETARQ